MEKDIVFFGITSGFLNKVLGVIGSHSEQDRHNVSIPPLSCNFISRYGKRLPLHLSFPDEITPDDSLVRIINFHIFNLDNRIPADY